ncbi:MAG: single-stranded-DNA-specific exonuclease RecJ [Clostridiales bacterium]|nr:single-stranded-DNA-specific exonuclease RecJ [Clostridiales bacterium]
MENKKWILKEIDELEVKRLMKNHSISHLAAVILQGRKGLLSEEANIFEGVLYDPFLLKNMQKAVDRINRALENNEKITIYGDFDADGVTATAVLCLYLRERGANVDYYIPDRIDEGYGVNIAALYAIKEKGTTLIITVDTGITAVEDIKHAENLGIDIIITDHHEPKTVVPDALAVIDPKQEDCKYPFKELAGVGVVFKLLQAFEKDNAEIIDKYMPLVCLGTIADVVPLIDENRELVKMGLERFEGAENLKRMNKGIKALLAATNPNNKKVTATMIGFVIAPRINAAGRLGSAKKSAEMFLCDDEKQAEFIAHQLLEENRHRQEKEHEIFTEAVRIIEKKRLHEQDIIVVSNKGWHQGVIGIVSSKITERYYKPSILISLDEQGNGRGSGRSISSFNLFEALSGCHEYLEKFGGHSLAAGLSIRADNIDVFCSQLNTYAKSHMKTEDFIPKLFIDCKLHPKDISLRSVEEMQSLEPFGMGNPTPVFMVQNAKITLATTMTEGRHFRVQLSFGTASVDAVGFSMGHLAENFKLGDVVNVAGTLNINEYNGNRKLQILLKDIKHA